MIEEYEMIKQFRANVYETEIIITSSANNRGGYQKRLNLRPAKSIKLFDSNGLEHDWIETGTAALNYHEVCGILILFGLEPPSYPVLCHEIGISKIPTTPTKSYENYA